MTVTTKRSLIALLLSLVLVVSLFTVGISADTTEADGTTVSTDATTEAEGTTAAEGTTEAEGTTKAEETTEKEKTSKEESIEASESVSESVEESESLSEVESEKQAAADARSDKAKTLIINGIIIAAIIVIMVVVAIKFRKKLGDFFRSVKSERKKIVWSSKENTRKSFLVVMVVAISIAILIGLIDVAFNTGIEELKSLFSGLLK